MNETIILAIGAIAILVIIMLVLKLCSKLELEYINYSLKQKKSLRAAKKWIM